MAQRRLGKAGDQQAAGITPPALASLASGAILAGAFPPLGASWLGWLGLVPLLMALRRVTTLRHAALCGWLAGFVFILLATDPLVTGYTWTGWAQVSGDELAAMEGRQKLLLRLVWLAVGAWVGLFWALFAALVSCLGASDLRRLAISAPILFVLLPEWLRTEATWGFHWALLGNLTSDWTWLRQLAAFGGVWPLSALLVASNVGLLGLVARGCGKARWRVAGAVGGVVLGALAMGWGRLAVASDRPTGPQLQVAAVQHHQPVYRTIDFAPVGLDRSYLEVIEQIARGDTGRVDLLVLPESIAMTVVSLDGSSTPVKPAAMQRPAAQWAQTLGQAIGAGELTLALGVDAVEQGRLHNSMTLWSSDGIEGWYHKQKLVPFSEFRPALFGPLRLAGEAQYAPGRASTVIELGGVGVGSFICQEVLFPRLLRRSVRNGAQLLVSGGNDGVFEHPAVAEVHAGLARLRAVESGRPVVRAMKTGISQIIGPDGEELARSVSSESAILLAKVRPLSGTTVYVRLGDWFLVAAGMVAVVMILDRARRKVRSAVSRGSAEDGGPLGAEGRRARFSASRYRC